MKQVLITLGTLAVLGVLFMVVLVPWIAVSNI
jgi:hypothetical protein